MDMHETAIKYALTPENFAAATAEVAFMMILKLPPRLAKLAWAGKLLETGEYIMVRKPVPTSQNETSAGTDASEKKP